MNFTGLLDDYRRTFANPFKAAGLGYIGAIIVPEDTRPHLASSPSKTSATRGIVHPALAVLRSCPRRTVDARR